MNKLINTTASTLTRTAANIFFLGAISALALFSITLVKATGDRVISTITDDVKTVKDVVENNMKNAA